MIVKAKFIGANSLGYVHGETYSLKILPNRSVSICKAIDGTGKCEYRSTYSFLRNWTDIKTI